MKIRKSGKAIPAIALVVLMVLSGCFASAEGAVAAIREGGVLRVGTTADYYPMTYIDEETGEYKGFDVELARDLADELGVSVEFVPTTWSSLMDDLESGAFDCAASGISITDARKERANLSKGYLNNGKTILCRADDTERFQSLGDVNREDVTVMVNPGGTNERFANEMLKNCTIVVHSVNYEIPELILQGEADVMITETVEAGYYISEKEGFAAPLLDAPFTDTQIGILIPKDSADLLMIVDAFLRKEQECGRLSEIARDNGIYAGCLCEVK